RSFYSCVYEQLNVQLLSLLHKGGVDELDDDRLRSADEVAELRLPQHQGLRALDGVAVLEAERRELRERGVVDVEPRLVVGEVGQRGPRVPVVVIDEHAVPLHEGAAAGVLAGQAHTMSLQEQRAEGQQLAE